MPLDAFSAALLDARRAAGIPPVRTQSLAETRGSRLAWRRAGAVPATPVDAIFERYVPVSGGRIAVRLYRPASEAPLPLVVYLHGGGWVLGDLDHSDATCRSLAVAARAVVVNVDYRLAPEHRYPVAAEDSYAAVLWSAANAPALGADPDRIAVAGASAGGNLAAAVTLMARERGGPRLLAQLLVYPVLDNGCASPSYREFGEGHIISTDDMRWYWEQYLGRPGDAAEPTACPLKAADLAALPPALVVTAECDPVRDDGERYADRLAAAGVAVERSRYPGTLHGFFAMPIAYDKADAAIREASLFLTRQFARSR